MEPIPETMTAVLLTGNGGFDKLDVRDDVPVPAVGPGQVLIKVGAAGVNNTDVNTRTGWYSKSVTEGSSTAGDAGFEAITVNSDWTDIELASLPCAQGFPALLTVLRPGGSYGTVGAIAGPVVDLDLRDLYLKDLTLRGSTFQAPEHMDNVVRYVENGDLDPVVALTFPLTEIVAAQKAFLDKAHVGKIVLVP